MKRVLGFAALVAALVVLLVPAGAQAHSTRWYWSVSRVEGALINNGLQWRDGYDGVNDAQCAGYDRYLYKSGVAYYKHLVCYIDPDNDYPYYIQFHVVGRNTYVFYFLRYA
jgi:hypothetical protein